MVAPLTGQTSDNSSQPVNHHDDPVFGTLAFALIEYVLIGVACVGVMVNISCLTIITIMTVKHKTHSRAEALLIQQQATSDLLVCLLTIAIEFYDPSSLSSEWPWREFECYFWYSQFFYWWATLLSAFNLMLIAVDWLLEVCFAEKHLELRKILGWMLFTIHICALGGAIPCIFTQQIDATGACSQPNTYSTDAMNAMFIGWMSSWFFFSYIIPIVLSTFCYAYMIYFYKKQIRVTPHGPTRKEFVKEMTHVMKCLISVAVFVLFVGFDCIEWFLCGIKVAAYVFNSPRQKFSLTILVVNSCANPLIHVIFSPDVQDFVSRHWRRAPLVADNRRDGLTYTTPL